MIKAKNLNPISLLFFLFFSLIFLNLNAQTGSISGIVTDTRTKEPIFGAAVVIDGTSTGTATDFDGKFRIDKLEPGNYTLRISYISYKTITLKDIVVKTGNDTPVSAKIEEDLMELGMVTTTAARVTNTESSVISVMRKSDVVISGISNEQIAKTQDSDAAQVAKRVPGVTIIGNRFIMVRGLSERYNAVMLNNAYAPSLESDIRSFSFDVLPSSLIDRMLIYKTASPELPGDFAGGVVKIYTKSIPDRNSFSASYSSGYRNGTTFQTFLQPEKGAKDKYGFNDGSPNLPAEFPSDVREIDEEDEESLTQVGRSLKNNWVPVAEKAPLNTSLSLTGSLRFDLGKIKLGNITALTYNTNYQTNDVERLDYNSYDTINDKSVPIYHFTDRQYNLNVRSGLLNNTAIKFGNNHIIEWKNLFNQQGFSQYVNRTGEDFEFAYFPNNHSFRKLYRTIYTTQVTGNHKLFNEKTSIDWMAGYASAKRDEPDYKRFRSDVDTATGNSTLYVPFGTAQAYFLGRFYSEMDELSKTGAFNVEQKLPFSERFTPSIKAGVFFETKDRTFSARNIGYTRSGFMFDYNLLNSTIDTLFMEENINPVNGVRIDEQTNPSDSYTAESSLGAGYLGLVIPVLKNVNINTGLRAEKFTQILNSATISNIPVEVNNETLHLLPSTNITYNFTEKMLVRGAYGKTINRPEFREIAPFSFYDFNFNIVNKGNDSLGTATIDNFDLRWEFYPSFSEIISVAGFYKKFTNAIETVFIPGAGSGGAKSFTYVNAPVATVYGAEIEVRKSLNFISTSEFVQNFGLLLNTSLIFSQVDLQDEVAGQSGVRPMQGQSPYIINAGIFFNDNVRRTQVNLLYNVIGSRILYVGYDSYPDIYEMHRHGLDFTFSQGIGKFVEIRGSIRDIINQDVVYLQDGNGDGKLNIKTDQVIMRFNPGIYYTMGLAVKF